MWIAIILLFLISFLIFKPSSSARLTKEGKRKRYKSISIQSNQYKVEEIWFPTYNDAHTGYFKIVNELLKNEETLETNYDLYDWNYSYTRTTNKTIGIKYFRNQNCIQIVICSSSIPLEVFLNNAPFYTYK